MVSINGSDVNKNWILVFVLGLILFAVYYIGSTSYIYLEDSDPYDHAAGVRFISDFGHPFQPAPYRMHYLPPYPPTFEILATIFYKITNFLLAMNIPESLKLFNSLLCGATLPFAYLWGKERYGERIGLWMTFILFCLPSFMSHFIWAQSLGILLMFPTMYLFEKGSKWSIPLMVVTLICQPSLTIIFSIIMGIYAIFKSDIKLTGSGLLALDSGITFDAKPLGMVIVAASASCLLYWAPMFYVYGFEQVGSNLGFSHLSTYPSQVYSIQDFIDAPTVTKIDQPTGFGVPIAVLLLYGAYLSYKERDWFTISLLAFCLIGTEATLLPFKILPHRFWVFLAIPVAIVAAKACADVIDKYSTRSMPVAIGLVIVMLYMCFGPKYSVETMQWWSSEFLTGGQMGGWLRMQSALPEDSIVFTYCMKETIVEGFGFRGRSYVGEAWNRKVINNTLSEDYEFLKRLGYQYVVLDTSCMLYATEADVKAKAEALGNDGRFEFIESASSGEVIVMRVI